MTETTDSQDTNLRHAVIAAAKHHDLIDANDFVSDVVVVGVAQGANDEAGIFTLNPGFAPTYRVIGALRTALAYYEAKAAGLHALMEDEDDE